MKKNYEILHNPIFVVHFFVTLHSISVYVLSQVVIDDDGIIPLYYLNFPFQSA